MLFHLICLKTSVLYKMLVGKYRFQKDVCSLQSGGEQGQFFLHFEARKCRVNPPLKVEEIWTPMD